MFKGAVCVSPKGAKRQHNRQTKWKCPPKCVGAGEESGEAVTLTEDTDTRPFAASCKASDNSDYETHEIPLSPKEEDHMENSSSEVLTIPALVGDTKSLAMAAIAALNACASSEGEGEQTPIDMGLFIQWLSNSDTVRKFINGESVPGIELASTHNKPTQSLPFSSKPDQLNLNTSNNSDRAHAGVAISKINAWIASLPSQNSRLVQDGLDVELLVHLFQNPEDIEKRIKEYDASYRSGNLSASMLTKAAADRKLHAIETTPESSLSWKNTVHEHNSSSITGSSSASQKIFSSVGTASKKMSLIDEETMLPEVTMVPMSPLYSSPSWESDMKTGRIINEHGTFADMRMEPRHMKSLISPVVSFSLSQTKLLELPGPSLQPTTNGLPLLPHRNPPLLDIENRIKEYDASYTSGNLSASMMTKVAADRKLHAIATSPESLLTKNTAHEHNSSSITGSSSPPQKIFSSVGTASKKMSLIDEETMLPELTMVPMSPLYSSPSANWESDMKTERIINEYGTFADMRMEPTHMKSLISPVVSFSLPQTKLFELPGASLQPTTNGLPLLPHRNPPLLDLDVHHFLGVSALIPMPRTMLVTSLGPDPSLRTDLVTLPRTNQQPSPITRHSPSACGHSTPLMNCSSSGGNIQVVGQGSTMLKPEKPCIYFNTTKGCYNGANCRYLHTKFDRASPSQVEELPNAKRMKLGPEISGSR